MFKGYDFLEELLESNKEFKDIIDKYIDEGKIRKFNDNEWDKIKEQNYISNIDNVNSFYDMFSLGYNKGNCVGMSMQLSYSYDNVDIVSGTLPILKGTLNAEKEGGHCWLETNNSIIDTSLLLVIDKSLKDIMGYNEEQRITARELKISNRYQARKEFTNDKNLRK